MTEAFKNNSDELGSVLKNDSDKLKFFSQKEMDKTHASLTSLGQYIEEQQLTQAKNNESKPKDALSIDKWRILNETAKETLTAKEPKEQESLNLDLPKRDLEVAKKVIGLSVERVLAKMENETSERFGASSFPSFSSELFG